MPAKSDIAVTAPRLLTWWRSPAGEAYQVPPARSDQELVEALLKFANTGDVHAYAALHPVRLDGASLLYYVVDVAAEPSGVERRLEVQNALAQVVDGGGDVPARLFEAWSRRASGLVLLPTFTRNRARSYHYAEIAQFDDEPRALTAYALLALLYEPFRGRLHRCKWAQCGRFFLQPTGRKGAPAFAFCPGTDHGKRAHQAGAVERMRKSRERARQRARAKRSKRGR
jgi:hypothetical protein